MSHVIHNDLWFINGHFFPIQKWFPNLHPAKAKATLTAVRVRLPQLPTKFYDDILLHKIGNSIGKLLKIDVCTCATLKDMYARLCIQVPMEKPITKYIHKGGNKQIIDYESDRFLCKWCGRLGHTIQAYYYKSLQYIPTSSMSELIYHK